MRHLVRFTLPLSALILSASFTVFGQNPQDPSPGGPPPDGPDLIGQLELTQDQIRSIRLINRDTKDQRAALGLRLREANRALQDAIHAPNLDEGLIEERLQELATAQNAQLRHRIQTELRIRRVLSAAQIAKWHELSLQAGEIMRQNRNAGQQRPGDGGLRPNQRNGIAPLNPRRGDLRNRRP